MERVPALCNRLTHLCDQVFQGDAADYAVLMEAGLQEAPSVVITTHETQESSMRGALAQIEALEAVLEPPRVIRIEAF